MLTLTTQQPTRTEFMQGVKEEKEGTSGSTSSPATSPRISKLTDPGMARIPKCARCRNHGIDCELKGHKEKCKFKNCSCRSCLVVVERQKVTATRVAHLRHQRKLATKRGSDTQDYRERNPLTEEEELILSRHLQNKASEESDYKRYSTAKNMDRYPEHYSDVIPPFANTKACMLLREAQSAYSYFYGKPYYPDDEKHEHYEAHMLSLNRSKDYEARKYSYRDTYSPTYSKTFKTVCLRDSDDYPGDKYTKYSSRSIIAPRVVRLDENQYYNEYFKVDKRDYYYEQKVPYHNNAPPSSKYERLHDDIAQVNSRPLPPNNRLIAPLKVNNTLEKEASHNREDLANSPHSLSKRLEVLVVMFPEIKEERLKEVLREHHSDIQSSVQSLLKVKNSPDFSLMKTYRSSTHAPSHNGGVLSEGYMQSIHNQVDQGMRCLANEKKPITKCDAQDAQELSAFTAVRRKCAR